LSTMFKKAEERKVKVRSLLYNILFC
jgi:hypothetical protein